MKSFDELAEAAFLAYEKSSSRSYSVEHSKQDWLHLHPELKAHWLAVAKEVVAHYAAVH